MIKTPQWIIGTSSSGKTTQLQDAFCRWVKENSLKTIKSPVALILAANEDNRRDLADRLAIAVAGRYPVVCKTF